MKEYNHLSATVLGTEGKAAYDSRVKELLSDKQILAWIMKYTMQEFESMTVKEIIPCIEGEPEISTIPVNTGFPKEAENGVKKGSAEKEKLIKEAITGIRNESSIPNEGVIFYDIRFYVVTPDKQQMKILVNLEAQKQYYPGYDLVTRALFYCARMISEQLHTEFIPRNYDDIKKVYSIWICMDCPDYAAGTITKYSVLPQSIAGSFKGKVRYDLLSAVMICLGKQEKEKESALQDSTLHGMLETLLSNELTAEVKLRKLKETYGMCIERQISGEVTDMCNLSDLIEEKGIAKGITQGIEEGKMSTLYDLVKKGMLSLQNAAESAGMTEEEFTSKIPKKLGEISGEQKRRNGRENV